MKHLNIRDYHIHVDNKIWRINDVVFGVQVEDHTYLNWMYIPVDLKSQERILRFMYDKGVDFQKCHCYKDTPVEFLFEKSHHDCIVWFSYFKRNAEFFFNSTIGAKLGAIS